MTACPLDLRDFVRDFGVAHARHWHHLDRAPDLPWRFWRAACEGNAAEVARLATSIRGRIRRERLWHLESLATARRQDARRQRFHRLAWGTE